MTGIVLLVIAEVANSGRYDAYADGRYLVTSAQPFLDGARALVAQGHDPALRLVMRRGGGEHDLLSAPLGVAAGLTVESSRFGRPTIRRHKGRAGVESASPVRRNRSRASEPTRKAA
jgi:hypothetical protein